MALEEAAGGRRTEGLRGARDSSNQALECSRRRGAGQGSSGERDTKLDQARRLALESSYVLFRPPGRGARSCCDSPR